MSRHTRTWTGFRAMCRGPAAVECHWRTPITDDLAAPSDLATALVMLDAHKNRLALARRILESTRIAIAAGDKAGLAFVEHEISNFLWPEGAPKP